MSYRFDATPNQNAIKITGPPLLPNLQGSRSVRSAEAAEADIEKALFAIPGVKQLFFLNDFLTVTKEEDVGWDDLVPSIQEVLQDHLS